MSSADRSKFGLARQSAKGTPNVTDGDFDYLLFTDGTPSPQSVNRPLDREVGGPALPGGVARVGVLSGADMQFIPRPKTLGELFYAYFGQVTTTPDDADSDVTDDNWQHDFTLMADQFDAPYYTLRNAPGDMWGEQYQDARLSALALRWRGADFLRGGFGFQGGLPAKVSTASWNSEAALDQGPQFLAPTADIEIPTGTPAKVTEGALTFASAMPLDQQWVVGSYSPDAMDIVNRAIVLSMIMKVEDETLVTKMAYDPEGGNAWTAELLKEADIKLEFRTPENIVTGYSTPYKVSVAANGQSGASANVQWTVQPINIAAGRLVTMAVSGMFIADPLNGDPITVSLTNDVESY
jgi:hypothetical protein